jgi:acetyltransferase-like isoleucine patch superfamily enzyme
MNKKNEQDYTKIKNRVGTEYNDFCIIRGFPKIGKDTWIGYFCLIDATGGLEIGNHCSIASGVHIYTHDSVRWAVDNLGKDNKKGSHLDMASVNIGNNVYIGANSVITKGVTIGDRAVIGALTLVNRDVPPDTIAVGVPCKILDKKTKKEIK